MNRAVVGVLLIASAGVLLYSPSKKEVDDVVVVDDEVHKAFVSYEHLWRTLAKDTADKLESGDLKTDNEVREYLANGQKPMREIAFEKVAEQEAKALKEWTAEKHIQVLRSYVK